MESLLSRIADAPASDSAKRDAYELVAKIGNNIIKAAQNNDKNLTRYKWVKAGFGSALRERVLSVSPLFRDLLETIGFRFVIGRPAHAGTGVPLEYFVFPDDADIEGLINSVQVIEAVIHSIPIEESPLGDSNQADSLAPSTNDTQQSDPDRQEDGCEATSCCTAPRSTSSSSSRRSGPNTELEDLRREQHERYRQRMGGAATASRPPAQGSDSGENRGDSGGVWFWQKFSWGGNNDDDDNSNSHGRSTSSRRPPPNSRMMTLRDLPKPQRRG